MQLTINSGEPLADVLRVVGGLYGVTLTTAEPPSGAKVGQQSVRRNGASVPAGRGRGTRAGTASRTGAADAKAVREWAATNGFEVSARGSLPAAVRDAYQSAHPA